MLFHDNIALFLPLKPSNFRYSAQIFVGHSTKIPHHSRHLSSLFIRRYSIDTPSLVHRFDGLAMEL